MKLNKVAYAGLIVLSLMLTACGNKENTTDTAGNVQDVIEIDSSVFDASTDSYSGKTLDEILSITNTLEPTMSELADTEIVEPTTTPSVTDTAAPTEAPTTIDEVHAELSDDLFTLLDKTALKMQLLQI